MANSRKTLRATRRLNRRRHWTQWVLAIAAGTALTSSFSGAAEPNKDWTSWRGVNHSGASENAKPPVQWDATKNVRWKADIPGKGSSTPIVLGNQVFVLTAVRTDRVKEGVPKEEIAEAEKALQEGAQGRQGGRDGGGPGRGPGGGGPGGGGPGGPGGGGPGRGGPGGGGPGGGRKPPIHFYRFEVLSFDLATGNKLWEKTVTEQVPHENSHNTNNFASYSPTTDGKLLYVSFGSRGVYALDLKGNIVWQRDLGKMRTRNEFGEGGSPTIFGDTLVVPWDQEENSSLIALNGANGEIRWKVERQERTNWGTPLIVEHKGRVQVITNGTKVRSYDLKDGKLIWEASGQTDNAIPTPILDGDYVIATTGFRGANAYSISLDAVGDVTGNKKFVRWQYAANTPYVPSPTLYKDRFYFLKNNNGVLTSLDAKSGEVVSNEKRIEGVKMVYSSIGAADGKLYITDRDGTTVVLEAGPDLKVLSKNSLEEEIDASPVFIDKDLLLRTDKHLFCLREAEGK